MTLNSEIESKLVEQGASLVGFADISDLPADVTDSMTSAISITVALDASIISEIADGPTQGYYQEYRRVNEFLAHLSETAVECLKGRGNRAAAISPTVEGDDLDYETLTTSLPHKTVATRTGLGWIGKSALLVTKKFGPAVRLATVLTDAEFEVGKAISSSRCGDCEKCVVHCPGKAILGKNWELGSERESIYDAFACCDTARRLSSKIGIPSTICGICISVCPWTQKYISRGPASQEKWTALRIYPVETDQDIESVRELFAEYGEFLKKELCEYSDLPWLVQYHLDFEKETANLPDRYGRPKGCLLLASYEGQPAGCVAFGELSDGICEMKRLYVREEYQRKGIGTGLCEALIDCARRSGYSYMRLATALGPPKVLYRSLGFKEIAAYRDIPREIEGVAHMELKLL